MIINPNYKDIVIEFPIRKRIEDDVAKRLKRYLHQILELDIHVTSEGRDQFKVNIICYTPHGNFKARAKDKRLYAAAMDAANKIRAQMDRRYKKLRNHPYHLPEQLQYLDPFHMM